MNHDMHTRLPRCDRLKDELYHAVEGSTRRRCHQDEPFWEGEAPAEPLACAERLQWLFNQLLRRNPAMNFDIPPRLGRSLALPNCDRLKDELFQALEGSTR
jgi:hypothetical protein